MDSSSSSLQFQQDDAVDGGLSKKIKHIFSSSRSRNASGQSNASSSSASLASNNQPPPATAEEMGQFVANLKDHSKMSKIRKELERSWVRGNMSHRVRDSGENIFHACVRMEGGDKIIRCLGEMVRGSSAGFEELDGGSTGGAVNDKNAKGYSPLHLAVKLAPLDNGGSDADAKISTLVGAGADKESLFSIGQQEVTPLQIAVFTGKLAVVKSLLKHRCNWERSCGVARDSLLHLACLGLTAALKEVKQSEREVELLDEGWFFRGRSYSTWRELEVMHTNDRDLRLNRYHPILQELMNHIKLEGGVEAVAECERRREGKQGLLHYLAKFGFDDCVKMALEEPFHLLPDVVTSNGSSPLLLAAKSNRLGVIEQLLKSNFDINVNRKDAKDGKTAMHHLMEKFAKSRMDETISVVEKLLSRGADPTLEDKRGETPIVASTKTYEFAVIACFLDFLSKLEKENGRVEFGVRDLLEMSTAETGETLLHHAAADMEADHICTLVKKGADLMKRKSPRGISARSRSFSAGGSLMSEGLPLREAIKRDNCEKYLDALLKLDLISISETWSRNTLDNFVWSHLIAAARYTKVDVIRSLFALMERKSPDKADSYLARLHDVLTTKESVRPPREEWEDMYGSEEKFKDRAADENFNTFKKTALAWAVQNHDRYSVTEIVHYERACHPTDRFSGIRCLKQQLRGGDEILKWSIETFSNKYGYTVFQKWVKPTLCCLPMLISPFLFAFDLSADVQLSLAYYQKGFNQTNEASTGFNATPQVINSTAGANVTSSDPYVPQARHYQAAFAMNVVCILLPFLVIMWMCVRELALRMKKLPSYLAKAIILITAVPLTPFYFIYMAINRVKSKFQHMGSEVKNEQRADLQKSEYLWGMARAAEAGLESSPQLILQLWLLSFHLCELSKEGVGSIGFYLDQAIDGALAFASAGRNEAGENQKNLAKILVSFITLSVTVSSSYKTLKRGSVRYGHLYFIYTSNFLQVLARCFSLFLYFTVIHDFLPAILIPLAVHYLITLFIKLCLDPARYVKGSFKKLALLVSITSSTLVNVSIKPLKTDEEKEDKKKIKIVTKFEKNENGDGIPLREKGQNGSNGDAVKVPNGHATRAQEREGESGVEIKTNDTARDSFIPQTAFFVIQFVENICLCAVALGSGAANPVLVCIGGSKWAAIFTTIVVVLSLFSWLGHGIYYGCWGHPWSDINGPLWLREMGGCGGSQYRPCNAEEDNNED